MLVSMPFVGRTCCPPSHPHHMSRALKKVEEEAEWERTPCLHFQSSAFLDYVRLRALATKWKVLAGQRTCSPPRRLTQESAMLPVFHSPLEVPTKSPENWLVIEKFVSGAKNLHPGKFCIFILDKSFWEIVVDHCYLCFQICPSDKFMQIDIRNNFFGNWQLFLLTRSRQFFLADCSIGQIFTNLDNRFVN